jgi:hypothetical protein
MIWNLNNHERPAPLFRYDDGGDRFYARVNDVDVKWYPSVTRIIKATSPTPPGLIAWYAKHGVEGANQLRDEAAERGTQMHILFERYMSAVLEYKGRYPSFIDLHTESGHWVGGNITDVAKLSEFHSKALMSFDAFYRQDVAEVYAVEMLLYSERHEFAGTCDLVCKLNNGKIAIVDFKSGTSVYDDYAVQLEMYRLAWNEHAEAHGWPVVTEIYNWLPKDWRTDPTWTWKRQTGDVSLNEIAARCLLFKSMNGTLRTPREKKIYTGTLPGQATIEIVRPEDIARAAYERLAKNDEILTDDDWLLSVGHS